MEGEGAFYGPKIDLHMNDTLGRVLADGDDPARRAACRERFELSYIGADNEEHMPVRDPPRAVRLARALHRHPDRALRRRLPVLARARADPDPPGRREPPRRRRPSWPRSSSPTGSRSTRPTTPSASGSATARSRRSRSWSSTATRSRTSRSRSGSTAAGRSTRSLAEFRTFLANLEPWQAGAKPSLTS